MFLELQKVAREFGIPEDQALYFQGSEHAHLVFVFALVSPWGPGWFGQASGAPEVSLEEP